MKRIMEKKMILRLILLVSVYHQSSSEVTPVQCTNQPGAVFHDCASGGGGTQIGPGPTPSGTPPVLLDCCSLVTYSGPDPVHYEYPGQGPFHIRIKTLNIANGEKIRIRPFRCLPNECKLLIIDHNAVAPLSFMLSAESFTVTSLGGSPSMTIEVQRDGCRACVCGWTEYQSHCYKIHEPQLGWWQYEAYCVSQGGHLASPSDSAEVAFIHNIAVTRGLALFLGSYTPAGTLAYVNTDGSPVLAAQWHPGSPVITNSFICSCQAPVPALNRMGNCGYCANGSPLLRGLCKVPI